MPTFENFTGINNVLPSHRLRKGELATALNVDIGLDGEIMRRGGYASVSGLCHKNLHEFGTALLSTTQSDLCVTPLVGVRTTLLPSLGMDRVWYVDLPDGRVAFANGLICGITDGVTVTGWGVPLPPSTGACTDISGALFPGLYGWQLTYVRLSDGLEGGAVAAPVSAQITLGGVMLTGLPALAGHSINVYLSSHNGGEQLLAGTTTGTTFAFVGANDTLNLPCRTLFVGPAPSTGTVCALWRGRALIADGNVLRASLPFMVEQFDVRRDFKQFSAAITLIQPVDDGVYVGTLTELAFLSGQSYGKT